MANCRDEETIQGNQSLLGFAMSDTDAPPVHPTECLEIDNSTFGIEPEYLDTSGIRGTEAEPDERNSEIAVNSTGGFGCRPTAADLERWLPRIAGGTLSSAVAGLKTVKMAEARPCFDAFDRNQLGELRTYRQNRVVSATFSASEKNALSLQVQTVGEDRVTPVGTGYTWPADVKPTRGQSFLFPQLQIVIAGTAYRIYQFSVGIQYMIQPQFMNSKTATAFPSTGRRVTLGFSMPWKRGSTVYELFRTGPQTVVITMDFGTGAARRTFVITGPKVNFDNGNKEPGIPGKQSITWNANLSYKYDQADANGPNNQIQFGIRSAGE